MSQHARAEAIVARQTTDNLRWALANTFPLSTTMIDAIKAELARREAN